MNFPVHDHTEVRVELQMDRWVARGGSVRLRCIHDIPPHLLDKVVFLRHGTKIFQYIRYRKPPYRNFTTPGAVLNVSDNFLFIKRKYKLYLLSTSQLTILPGHNS